jgi:hypothetical protein
MSEIDEPTSMHDAIEQSQFANMSPEEQKIVKAEKSAVKKSWDEYKQQRVFDQDARAAYAIDRRYAAGTADKNWAVNTNLIGNIIDILVSFLYARDPDVSVKKAKRVDNRGSKEADTFAQTIELVVSRLWKKGALKKQAKKAVRSGLSVGVGWLKVILICDKPENPKMQGEMNDLRDNLAALADVERQLGQMENADTTEVESQMAKQEELIASLELKIEATIRKYLAIDFVPAQDMSTSLDVAAIEDYLDADWNANAIYIPKSQAQEKFPRLTEEEVKGATTYFQRTDRDQKPLTDNGGFVGLEGSSAADAKDAEYYTTNGPATQGITSSDTGMPFVKIVEKWDKRTNHIHTHMEGVDRWAVEPFQPPYASSRFYPYFRIAFFEVDGARHAQSLSGRLAKLQDEYARSRSNFRLTRERSIPGVFVNAASIDPKDVKKIVEGTIQEITAINPINPQQPMRDMFTEKPIGSYDPRIYDNTPILADMEKVSGVQEALQSSATPDKTATQANIEQSGFASRTTADRDILEDVLTDLANYTAEVALGGLSVQDAQRIAGPAAFWPAGMAVEDIVTMVEVEIKAGTTGKPNEAENQQAWGVILPVLKEAIIQIHGFIAAGQIPLAKAMSELVRRTMTVMGDDTDPELFIPEIPEEIIPGEVVPGMPVSGAPLPVADPSLPPTAGGGEGAEPPIQEPTVQAPQLDVPSV